MATFDGQFVFGVAVRVKHVPNAAAIQEAAYCGANGVVSSYGGGRGRIFQVQGLFVGDSRASCAANESIMLSFADGLGHTLVDNLDNIWTDVIFKGEIDTLDGGPIRGTSGGYAWFWPYKLLLRGLR